MTSIIVLAAAAFVFPLLLVMTAPYGRYARRGFGPMMPARLGWVVMEAVAFFVFLWAYSTQNPFRDALTVRCLAGLWAVHYFNRTFVFPLQMKDQGKHKPIFTVAMAVIFNALNGWGNGAALVPREVDARLILGVAMFVTGFAINLSSDAALRALRKPGESGYKIPYGGLYRWVSCPNYLGELIEWTGFAIAAWTAPAVAFAVFTFANLFPRALAHHRWYREKFPDYPKERRAIIPWVL